MLIKLLFLTAILYLFEGSAEAQQKYITKTFTDHHGYQYEAVSNDPVGLRVYTLKNGLTVYLAQDKDAPEITYATAIRAGSAYDPKDNTGLAHYLEHLLFNGTDKIGTLDWTKEQPLLHQIEDLYEQHKQEQDSVKKNNIYRQIDSISYEASQYGIKGEYRKLVTGLGGVAINGTTNFEYIIYGCVLPAPSLAKFLLLEKDRFSHPSFRAFHTELEIVYEEFNSMQDNDFIQKYFPANKLLFKVHPYGQQIVIGTSEHLKNPSIKAIKDYFQTYYVPNNMAVILIGDLDFDKTIQEVDNTFGAFPRKEFHRKVFPKEDDIVKPVEIEVASPLPASTFIGFRLAGYGTEDEKYIELVNQMLSNNVAGMFNLELVSKLKVKSANSMTIPNNDYTMQYFTGTPTEGQSLEDVKVQLLSVLDKIKNGEFDEWLIGACAKDIKKDFLKDITVNQNLDAACAKTFIHFQNWRQQLEFEDELQSITKAQLIAFAKRAYQNNYVVVYKRQGPSTDLVKVDNPQITPIQLNEDKESEWAKDFTKTMPPLTEPEFIDYAKVIDHTILSNGISVAHVENKKNDLFELNVIFDMGKSSDKKIPLAVNYIPFIGTPQYTSSEWKMEFYKLGLTYSFRSQNDQTIFRIEGLQENMEDGIRLLNHLFDNLTPNQQSYNSYIQSILDSRKSNRTNRSTIRQALVNFALYGEESAWRNIYTEAELRKMDPHELTDLIRNLRHYKHHIFYYGNDLHRVVKALEENYVAENPVKENPIPKTYMILPSKPVVYFVNYEGAQAEVAILARGEKFNKRSMSLSNMFNRFFEKVDFKEIRESRSLAYSAWAAHMMSDDTINYDYVEMYAGTQVNKVMELLNVSTGLMKDISGTESVFNEAKADQLKRYQRERLKGANIYWSHETLRKQGIQNDFRENIYNDIRHMSFPDMLQFFKENIATRDLSIVLVGDKKDIDMSALRLYGEVKELDVDYLFNYTP